MKQAIRIIFIVVIGLYSVSCSQPQQAFIDKKDAYFGLTPPGIVSDSNSAEHSQVAVSTDGQYFFFMRHTETQDFF